MLLDITVANRSALDFQADTNWDAVYADQLPRIYNFFRYRVGDGQIAEDLTAITFEKAWRKRESYRHDLAAFSTWLHAIARNVAIDFYRREKPQVELEDNAFESNEPRPDDYVQQQQDFAKLHAMLETLPERDRELVALKYGAEMTNRQIADIVGISESNVGTRLHRLVSKLRVMWEVSG